MKKQTAVEWLLEGMLRIENDNDVLELINKALTMEREQIEDAYGHGQNNGYMYANQKAITIRKDQYYNETYKSYEQ